MRVEICGPAGDPSGYGHDCRQLAHSLMNVGVDLSIKVTNFDKPGFTCDYGAVESVLRPRIKNVENVDAQLLVSTPEFWEASARKDCYTIGRVFWETDRIDSRWVDYVKESDIDELWLPSQWQINVFRKDFPTMPMTVVPCAHDTSGFDVDVEPLDLSEFGVSEDTFIFGAGFQWTKRKNPQGLITAYLAEFSESDPVTLVLKTYGADDSDAEVQRILGEIVQIQKNTGLSDNPSMAIITQLLSFEMMLQFRKRTDCGVYPHRGEGWGLHISESMLMGTPCIVTDWSATTEFCDETNSYLIDSTLTPVSGMPWCPWYNARQNWAGPDLVQLRKAMRQAFDNREALEARGSEARKKIETCYSLEAVGALMRTRLMEIE